MSLNISQFSFAFLTSAITDYEVIFTFFILILILLLYIYLFIVFPIFKRGSIFLKNFLLSPKTHQTVIYIGFVILFSILVLIFFGETYFVEGNIHDMWIPKVGAYAIKHGLVLHQDFHTPFGFMYNGLNYISLLIIESFPSIFNLFDMIMLSSILFSFIIISLFYLMRVNTTKAMPITLLLVILSIIPQVRLMSELSNTKAQILWYSSYNKHLWGLLLLQIVHLFCWKKFLIKNIDDVIQVEKNNFLLFLALQIICAYIFFNYKINFFAASSLIIFSIFFILPLKLWFKYIIFSISFFLLLVLSTFVLSGYSYISYLEDIHHIVLSRGGVHLDLNYLYIYLFIFFLIRVCAELFKNKPEKIDPISFFKHYFYKSKSFLKNDSFLFIKQLLFDCCIGFSLLIGATGSYFKATGFFVVVFLFYLIINTSIINIKRICYLVLGGLFLINIFSLSKVVSFKFYKEESLEQSKHQLYKTKSITTKNNRNYPFVVWNGRNMDMILNELREKHPRRIKNLFDGIVYDDDGLWIALNNIYYIDLLNDILLTLPKKLNKNDKILLLEFINPLPILLDSKPIQGAYHWFHFGVTFSDKTMDRFNKTFENADFVYVPMLSTQSFLKCYFYKWHFQNNRFALSSIHNYGFLLATHQKIEEYNLQKLEFPNPGEIIKPCPVIKNH